MMQRQFFLSGLILAFALFGCQSKVSQSGKTQTLKINLGNEPHSLDPRLARDTSSQTLMRMFFEGLTRINPHNRPELALATRVEVSEDLKTYTFTLRDAKWSNGDLITAHDFVYSWSKTLSPNFQSDSAYHLYLIKGAKGVKEGKIPKRELGVLATDDHTLRVELESPTPYFLEALASPIFFPVNQRVDQMEPHWAQKQKLYVCSGPFLLKSWHHHDEIMAEKNPNYWDAKSVHLDRIEMAMVQEETELKLFEKGALQWAGSPLSTIPIDAIESLEKQGSLFVQSVAGTSFIRSNVLSSLLKSPKMRKALALSIDRGSIVEHVTKGAQLVATSLVPPGALSHGEYFEDDSKEMAALLFEEALKEEGLERNDFKNLELLYVSLERAHLIAQAIQDQWRSNLGIEVKLTSNELKVYFDRVSRRDYDLALGSWLADFNDPVNFLEVFKYKNQSTNNTGWENPKYVKLLDESFQTVNAKERYQQLCQCENILMEEMPVIPIFHYTMLYVKDENLQGVFLSSLGNIDFKWATIDNQN